MRRPKTLLMQMTRRALSVANQGQSCTNAVSVTFIKTGRQLVLLWTLQAMG